MTAKNPPERPAGGQPERISRTVFMDEQCLVPELRMIGWTLYPEADAQGLANHRHEDAHEICYLVDGQTTWWVDDEIIEVEPGDLYLTWPGEWHGGIDGAMHPCELYWAQIVLPPAGRTLDLGARESRQLHEAFDALAYRRCAGSPSLRGHFQRILQEHHEPGPMSPAIVRACLRLLCFDVLRDFERGRAPASGQRQIPPRIHETIQWFRRHLGDPISISDAADRAGLSSSHFRTEFRQATGFSPLDYLTQLRLREAKQLLANSTKPVTDIAFELGFTSSQYFSTVFRKYTGLTPSQFRRRRAPKA